MLTYRYIEPISKKDFKEEVAPMITISARTTFMLKELRELFKQDESPEVGCSFDPKKD
jgi:hypothetical protein